MNNLPRLDKLTRIGLLLFAFSIPWSSALYRVSMLLVFAAFVGYVVHSLFSKNEVTPFPAFWKIPFDPIWLFAIALSSWVALTILWTSGRWELYFFDTWRYIKLWMIPVFAYLICRVFLDKPHPLIQAFCLGCVFLMIPSFMDFFGLMHLTGLDMYLKGNPTYSRESSSGLDLTYFRNHIVHGFHVSLLFGCVLLSVPAMGKFKWLNICIALCCIFDIVHLISGKMALLSLALSMLMVAWYGISDLKKRLHLLALLMIIFGMTAVLSTSIQGRLMLVWSEAQDFFMYRHIQSSGGNRLHYWQISLAMFADHPIWGAGAGAFRQSLELSQDPLASNFHYHTHNEYLSQLSQFGLVGFFLFLGLLISVFKACQQWRANFIQACGLIAVFIFGLNAFSDSSLHNEWEGWTLIFFSSLVLSQKFSQYLIKQQ